MFTHVLVGGFLTNLYVFFKNEAKFKDARRVKNLKSSLSLDIIYSHASKMPSTNLIKALFENIVAIETLSCMTRQLIHQNVS